MALRKFLTLELPEAASRRTHRRRSNHSRAPELVYELTQFGEQCQGLRCFGLVDTAHCEPDMHEHPIADAGSDWVSLIDNTGEMDFPKRTGPTCASSIRRSTR